MPPKKTKSPMPEEKPPEKVVKKRVRAVKPKLKIPTVVKVKIPSDPSLYTNTGPKLTRKQLTTQIKIDLANEVARAQLVKPELVLLNNVPEVKPVRRRRAKKVISEFFNDADTPVPAVASDPLVKSEPMLLNNVSEVKPVRRGRAKKAISDFSSDADTPAPAVASDPLNKSVSVLLNNASEVKPVRRGRAKKVTLDVSSDADTPAPAEAPKKTIKLIRPKPTDDMETEKKPIATAKKRVTNSTDKPKPAKKARVIKTKTGITNNCKTTCEPTKDSIATKSKVIRKSRPRRVKEVSKKIRAGFLALVERGTFKLLVF